MATYDEAIKALEAIDNGADLVAAIAAKLKADTDAEKLRGITEKKKVDNEARGLRERLKKVTEPLGLDPESEDFDTQVGEYKTLKEKGPQKANVQSDPLFVQMKKDLERVQADNKARADREAAQRTKAVDSLKKAALTKAMSEKKVIPDAMDDLMVSLGSRVIVDDNDNISWKGDAEGEVFTVEDGLGKFLEKKPIYVTNSQNPGGGGGPGAGGGNGSPKKEPSVEDRRKELATLTRSGI